MDKQLRRRLSSKPSLERKTPTDDEERTAVRAGLVMTYEDDDSDTSGGPGRPAAVHSMPLGKDAVDDARSGDAPGLRAQFEGTVRAEDIESAAQKVRSWPMM